jgi:hypothetical protein
MIRERDICRMLPFISSRVELLKMAGTVFGNTRDNHRLKFRTCLRAAWLRGEIL